MLTDYAKEYLLEDSPYYFGDVLDLIIKQHNVRSYSSIKMSVLQGKPQIYEGKALFEENNQDPRRLRDFTKAMHGKSIGPAQAWVKQVVLGDHKKFLDIGGGAGTHTIMACRQWEHLTGIVYDRAPVCSVCHEYIEQYQLGQRISTYAGNMWDEPYPQADVHFLSDILHDWPVEQCRFLLEKSFLSLPQKGKLIIHEMVFNQEKTGPLNVAAYNLNMLLWTDGQQFSRIELEHMLFEQGFVNITTLRTFGDWHIIMGEKP